MVKKSLHSPDTVSSPQRFLPWIVWGLGCLFYFYEFLLQVSPGVMSNELMRDFSVTGQALGMLSAVYFYSYAAMQLPGGVLMDYYGPHRLLTLATLVCAVSTIAFGLTESYLMACLARFMVGFGSAFAAVGAMKLAANWFPANRFALLTGIMVTIGMLGAIGGETPLALLIDAVGWRRSMVWMGSAGLGLALLIWLIAKDAPSARKVVQRAAGDPPLAASLLKLLSNTQLWLVAIYGGLMYLVTPVFCGLWGVQFLMFRMHIPKTAAAGAVSLVFVGWAIAAPLWGAFSNHIGRRKPPLWIGNIGALICCLLFIYAPIESLFLMQCLLLFFGIFSAGFLPSFALAKELCDRRYVATGLSFMNMMNMLGIALVQPLTGFVLDALWTGEVLDGVRVYPLSAYHMALSLLPLGMMVSLLILPRIHETHCHQVEHS